MNSKILDHYFLSAQKLPLAAKLADIEQLVMAPTSGMFKVKPWWRMKPTIIIAAATAIAASAVIWTSTARKKANDMPKNAMPIIQTESRSEPIPREFPEQAFADQYTPQEIPLVVHVDSFLQEETPVEYYREETDYPVPDEKVWEMPELIKPQYRRPTSLDSGKTRVIRHQVSSQGVHWLDVRNFGGNISIETGHEPVIQLEAFVSIEANKAELVQKALEDCNIYLVKQGQRVKVVDDWFESGKGRGYSKLKITTHHGGEKIKISKYRVDYVLTVPEKLNLDLSNSYGNITMSEASGQVNLNCFHGNIRSEDIAGDLKLTLRYGRADMGNMGNAQLTILQSRAEWLSAKDLDLEARYSTLKMEIIKSINLSAFQSNLKAIGVREEIKGKMSYGSLSIEDGVLKSAVLELFHGRLQADRIGDMDLNSSYSNIRLEAVSDLNLENCFQNTLKIEEASKVHGKARYSSLRIGSLDHSVDLEAFQGRITVDDVRSGFKSIHLDTKYTPVNLSFDGETGFRFNATATFSNIRYPKNQFTIESKSVNHNSTEMSGTFHSGSGKLGTATVDVTSFHGQVVLK